MLTCVNTFLVHLVFLNKSVYFGHVFFANPVSFYLHLLNQVYTFVFSTKIVHDVFELNRCLLNDYSCSISSQLSFCHSLAAKLGQDLYLFFDFVQFLSVESLLACVPAKGYHDIIEHELAEA
jgi:hypothetical protein